MSDANKFFANLVGEEACASAFKSASNIDGKGQYKLSADKMAVSTVVATGTAEFAFADACVKALGIANSASECSKIQTELTKDSSSGIKSATCSASGATCNCTVDAEASIMGSSSYTVSGDKIMVNGLIQPFCVEGGKLSLQTTTMGVTATLHLSR